MADTLTKEKRSWNMSRIRGKDTQVEVKVRKYLFSKGFRYRKNVTDLPGKPDIVLPKYKTVVFIHGCFWHRHPGCKYSYTPKSNIEFWEKKFSANVKNDDIKRKQLEDDGWRVIVLWECDVERRFEQTMEKLVSELLETSQSG
ncbi:MAG TPA: very short patch repair endonuclease [Ruminococcaceae bacterium]|nr:very short patch repair endonuclease [Oscillospiraceae bacterium]